jgi:multiple sugar transport system permease protein
MPLISEIGRRSLPVRLLITAMYLVLTLGAVSMAYPFLLMLSMGTTGRPDYQDFRLIPRYWVSDAALFKRYLLDLLPIGRQAWWPIDDIPANQFANWFGKDHWFLSRDVKEDDLAEVMAVEPSRREAMASDLRAFLAGVCPKEFSMPSGIYDKDSALALQNDYYPWLEKRYGTLENVNRLYSESAAAWTDLGALTDQPHRQPGTTLRERDWQEFLQTRPPERAMLFDADQFVYTYVLGRNLPIDYNGPRDKSGNIIRSLITCDDIQAGKLGPKHKETFLRAFAPARYIQIDTTLAAGAWRTFLRSKEKDPDTVLAARMPVEGSIAGLWSQFVHADCPVEALSLVRPEDSWRSFLKQRYGTAEKLNQAYGTRYASLEEAQLPWAVFKYDNFLREKTGLRLKYLLHNFKTVFAFVAVHGSALKVTLIYIVLMIAGTLTVNPFAAYAMSRFRLQETHHILIFLLATMAFPGEVLMIPNFLMIKSFPWLAILAVIACALGFYLLARTLGRRLPLVLSASVAFALTLVIVIWVLPGLARRFDLPISTSLMNTFWALILPGLANGYGIFLLKGFFDSLPPELYEAGLIDGASEMRMFWQITLPLCKPILAVMALGAFSAAYGAFMHAFLICQDPRMWTFMVFLYEFQQLHIVPLVMASLVVAAIPTLLVFIFCQNIILRGIVIPSFK